MTYGKPGENVSSPIVFVSHYSPIFAFCNGNQRFALRRHWQLSAYCLKNGISKDLYRAAVMSPKLEMSAVEQRLFLLLSSPLCHSNLLNHPSTQQTCHSHCTPLQAANSHGPHRSLFTLWCILQKSAYLGCRRAVWQSLPLLLHCLLYD